MAVEIVGCWEYAWQAPLNEYDLWIHPINEFNVSKFTMTPVSGIMKSKVSEVNDLAEVINTTNKTVVFVDENGKDELPDFEHPEDVLYVVGKTTYSPYKMLFDESKHKAVKIPSINNSGGFWGHQAISMVLYDRMLKGM